MIDSEAHRSRPMSASLLTPDIHQHSHILEALPQDHVAVKKAETGTDGCMEPTTCLEHPVRQGYSSSAKNSSKRKQSDGLSPIGHHSKIKRSVVSDSIGHHSEIHSNESVGVNAKYSNAILNPDSDDNVKDGGKAESNWVFYCSHSRYRGRVGQECHSRDKDTAWDQIQLDTRYPNVDSGDACELDIPAGTGCGAVPREDSGEYYVGRSRSVLESEHTHLFGLTGFT